MTTVKFWVKRRIASFVRDTADDSGQGLAEYALILALVAVLCATALTGLQGAIDSALGTVPGAF